MPPKSYKNEIAPSMMAVTFHLKDFIKSNSPSEHEGKVVTFIKDYVINPSREKSFCDKVKFVASHGYTVIYVPNSLDEFDVFMENEKDFLDMDNIGVIGHSVGGGKVFKILLDAKEKGWGDKNRFIFSIEPWYIGGGITKEEIRNLPKNTNFVLQQYGTKGDNNGNDISGKVPLTQYYLLDSINNRQKDYQTIDGLDHGYPHNEVNQMPYLVNPLEALMKYTFTGSNNESLRLSALDIGNDDPYTTHKQILNNNKPCRNSYNKPKLLVKSQ